MDKYKSYYLLIIVVMFFIVGCEDKSVFVTEESEDLVKIENQEVDTNEHEEELIVEIKGEVIKPGVYKITEGDRLNDLLLLAGGPSEFANLKNINLAIRLVDGESFYIPKIGEEEIILDSGQNSKENPKNDLIDLNNASKEELMKVPGIGPQTSDNIINYREENGKFKSIEELLNVNRIGEKTLEKLREYFIIR